jgi:hypothetical protein
MSSSIPAMPGWGGAHSASGGAGSFSRAASLTQPSTAGAAAAAASEDAEDAAALRTRTASVPCFWPSTECSTSPGCSSRGSFWPLSTSSHGVSLALTLYASGGLTGQPNEAPRALMEPSAERAAHAQTVRRQGGRPATSR